jgi:uncharacterized circularly permuted ATP-grasp superfamily protein
VGDLLDGYEPTSPCDEMLESGGRPRHHYATLYEQIQTLSSADLDERCAVRDRVFRDRGITFAHSGEEERPFPLDLVPRVISAAEWSLIERGVAQRVRALERFLADVYGRAEIVRDGVIPRRLIATSKHFHRAVAHIEPSAGVRIHVAGIDLVRDGDGRLRVLEDNVRTPSGISYVVENRRAMTHVFPELFASHRVRPVADYPGRLLEVLRATAPPGVVDPTVVVLTPGIHNAAYFEHSFLARQMGVELVEGRDLFCRDNRVFMRTTAGDESVHVVYRRIDDEYLDPLHFRSESVLGCAGLINAARAGMVTLANFVGNGVADDKAVYPFVPAMIEYYCGEKPVLDNVETYDVAHDDIRDWALGSIDRLVWKPVDGSGGYGLVIGPRAGDEELARLRAQVVADPRGWIAQEPVALSTAPTYVDGAMGARHVDLRPFALHDGERVWVVPGGLTRVALPEGSLVVNSSQGGGSKDTWVLAAASEPDVVAAVPVPADALPRQPVDPGPPANTGPATQQQQQQQQTHASLKDDFHPSATHAGGGSC